MDSFEGCDLLVLACPIRFSGPSSILKAAMDRFQPYWRRGRARGGFSAAMVCGGGPRPDFSPSVRMFRAFSITVGLEWAGCLEVPGTDGMAPADAGPPAREFGLGLAGIAARGPAGGIV
jgi:hypothetical protein